MKNLIVLTFLICLGQFASAQRQNERSNDIESYKVAYLTSKLELTPEESRAFWPIYNNWQKEQTALRAERAEKMISFRKTNEIDDLSDSQVESLLTSELNFKQKALNIEKKYYYQLKSVLPIKTVGKYYRAQETFKRELLNRYRDGKKRD